MHILVRERVSIDEEEGAVDLDAHAPADVVFLSFSDGDLAAIEAAGRRHDTGSRVGDREPRATRRTRCRLTCSPNAPRPALGRGGGAAAGRPEPVALRRGGAVRGLQASARVPLAIVRGEGLADPLLDALSTVDPASLRRLEAMLREGGPENASARGASRARRSAAAIPRHGRRTRWCCPAFGTHDFGERLPRAQRARHPRVLPVAPPCRRRRPAGCGGSRARWPRARSRSARRVRRQPEGAPATAALRRATCSAPRHPTSC